MPKYLIAFNDEWVPPQTSDELRRKSHDSNALLDEMKDAGVFLYADGGVGASTALFTVESKGGKPVFTDGPFAESKEHVGGFTIIEVEDDEAARHWAGRLAVSLEWPQEVHRFPSGVEEIIEHQSSDRA